MDFIQGERELPFSYMKHKSRICYSVRVSLTGSWSGFIEVCRRIIRRNWSRLIPALAKKIIRLSPLHSTTDAINVFLPYTYWIYIVSFQTSRKIKKPFLGMDRRNKFKKMFKSLFSVFILRRKHFYWNELIKKTLSSRGGSNPDLRIPSEPSAVHASTAYKYDALTDCATGAWWPGKGFAVYIKHISSEHLKNK